MPVGKSTIRISVGNVSHAVSVTVTTPSWVAVPVVLYLSAVTVTVLASPESNIVTVCVTVHVTVGLASYIRFSHHELSSRAMAVLVKYIAVAHMVPNKPMRYIQTMRTTQLPQPLDFEDLAEAVEVLSASSSRSDVRLVFEVGSWLVSSKRSERWSGLDGGRFLDARGDGHWDSACSVSVYRGV